jgi:hypothetical protein
MATAHFLLAPFGPRFNCHVCLVCPPPSSLRALYLGTFVLTDEPVDEPPKLLASEVAKAGLPPTEFQAVPHGTVVTV